MGNRTRVGPPRVCRISAPIAILPICCGTNLPPDELLLLNDAIETLAAHDHLAAELVKLRYFVGLSVEDAAETIGIPRTSAYRHWTYARAWLIAQVRRPP